MPIAVADRFDGIASKWGVKAPGDRLDYAFACPLLPEETLLSSPMITVAPGDLTVDAVSIEDASAVLWIEGGSPGITYVIAATIGTSQGRTFRGVATLYVGPIGLDDPSPVAPAS